VGSVCARFSRPCAYNEACDGHTCGCIAGGSVAWARARLLHTSTAPWESIPASGDHRRRKNRATNRPRKWVTCNSRNFGHSCAAHNLVNVNTTDATTGATALFHSCKSFMNGVVVWFTPRPMLALAVAVLTVPTTHVVCETSVAVGDGRIVFELWPHSAPGRLAVNVCALPTTLIHI